MEPCLYNGIKHYVLYHTIEAAGLPKSELSKWTKRLQYFTIDNDGLLCWKEIVVPTMQQVEEALRPVHYAKAENHCKDWRVLRNVLAAKGYGLPPFLGGLKRACVM